MPTAARLAAKLRREIIDLKESELRFILLSTPETIKLSAVAILIRQKTPKSYATIRFENRSVQRRHRLINRRFCGGVISQSCTDSSYTGQFHVWSLQKVSGPLKLQDLRQ